LTVAIERKETRNTLVEKRDFDLNKTKILYITYAITPIDQISHSVSYVPPFKTSGAI